MKLNLEDVSCSLLPGKWNPFESPSALYAEIYRTWKGTWGDIFTKSGSPQSLNAENFLRQDLLICLHKKDELVGLVTSTLFNLGAEATFDHPYLRAFPAPITHRLKQSGAGLYTTGEYLSVQPDYRKSFVDFSFSEVLVGLLMKTFLKVDAKLALATTVRPLKVHEAGFKYGYWEVGAFEKYGLDCVLLANSPQTYHDHPNADVQKIVNEFWSRRIDQTGLTKIDELRPFRKAA